MLKQKFGNEIYHPSLCSQNSSSTLILAGDGLPLNISSNLLRLFSPFLTSLLDLPPCVTTSIIVPDTSMKTASSLLELLMSGSAVLDSAVTTNIQELSEVLGISLGNLSVLQGGDAELVTPMVGRNLRTGSSSTLVTRSSTMRRKSTMQRRGSQPANGGPAPNIIRNIKEEVNSEAADVVSKFNCEICKKHFNAPGPLAFHYCKHFYKELQSLQFPDYMEDTKCNKCEKMLPDKKAMLCHLGVKHKFINQVLSLQGLQKIPLGSSAESVNTNVKIKMEKQAASTSFNQRSSKTRGTKSKPADRVETPKTRQGRNSKEIKEVKFCEICDKEWENVSQLANHMISSHMLRDIKDRFNTLYNGKECTICSKSFSKNAVWMHLGSVHNKLDEILMEKGLRPLKIQVAPNIRKIVVKRERMEEDSNTGDVPDYQLPNLFETVSASASGQEQVNEDSNGFDPTMLVADPLGS